MNLLEALNATVGLWTALAAIAAAVASAAAIWSNTTTVRTIAEARNKERPWLNTSTGELVNKPGGFQVRLGIRNYGTKPAMNDRINVWRCTSTDEVSDIRSTSSANVIVPTEEVNFVIESDNHTPIASTYLVVRIIYEDDKATRYESWMFYNWPVLATGQLASAMRSANIEPATALKTLLAKR